MNASTLPIRAEETKVLSPGKWLVLLAGIVLVVFLLNLAICVVLDPFGILRSTRGRRLTSSEDERKAKYLLSENYVPANFDALVIGASGSVNWDLNKFTGYRFYNESVFGGNASEQRKLVERALVKGHYKVALIGFHPLITEKHTLHDGLDQVSATESLGSVALYRIMGEMILRKMGRGDHMYDMNGSRKIGRPKQAPSADRDPDASRALPVYDETAVNDYRELVNELTARNIRVIYVIYPQLGIHYHLLQAGTDAWVQRVLSEMPPEPTMNFLAPDFESFRDDPNNFVDEAHVSPHGSEVLSEVINSRMHEILHDQAGGLAPLQSGSQQSMLHGSVK